MDLTGAYADALGISRREASAELEGLAWSLPEDAEPLEVIPSREPSFWDLQALEA